MSFYVFRNGMFFETFRTDKHIPLSGISPGETLCTSGFFNSIPILDSDRDTLVFIFGNQ